jgi:hypothetical protein
MMKIKPQGNPDRPDHEIFQRLATGDRRGLGV